jgi:hypothetical protein
MVDAWVNTRKELTPVIPAKAGIQCLTLWRKSLDPGFRRDDVFVALNF